MVLALDVVDLLQVKVTRTTEAFNAVFTPLIVIRATAPEIIIEVRGRTTHQGHISPTGVCQGHTSPWTIGTQGRSMLQ